MSSSKNLSAIVFALIAAQAFSGCLKPNNSASEGRDTTTFYSDAVTTGQVTPTKTDSLGFTNEKTINLSACLKDKASTSPIVGEPFRITDAKGNSRVVTSNGSGCLVWSESFPFDYLAPESYIPIKRTITSTRSNRGTLTVSVAFNPWHDQLVDLAYNAVPANGRVAQFFGLDGGPNPNQAQIDLQTVQMQFLGMAYDSYHVNRMLTLSVAQNYRMRMSPTLLRQGLNQWITETPQKAKMKVTLVLLSAIDPNKGPDAKYVVGEAQKIIEVNRGLVIEDLTVNFTNIASATSRMQTLIELEPLTDGGSRDIIPARFTGPMGPLPNSSDILVARTPWSAVSLRDEYLKDLQAGNDTQLTGEQLLEKYSGMKPLPTGGDAPLSAAEVLELLNPKKASSVPSSVLRKACNLIFPEKDPAGWRGRFSSRWTCRMKPSNAVRIVAREMIEEINSDVPRRTGINRVENLNVSTVFSRAVTAADSKGSRTTKNATVGVNGGLELSTSQLSDSAVGKVGKAFGFNPFKFLKLGANASVGYGKEWFKTTTRTQDTTASKTVSATRSITLTAEANTFEIDATTRRCVLIGPNIDQDDNVASIALQLQGYYVCEDKTDRKTVTETYYLVNEMPAVFYGSPITDFNDASEMPYRMFIRGDSTYLMFKSIVSNPHTALVIEREENPNDDLLPNTLGLRTTQIFPGMLSSESSATGL